MQKTIPHTEMKSPKPMIWNIGFSFPFRKNSPKCPSMNSSPAIDTASIASSISHDDINYGKGAESLCTTNSEGDCRSPEEFDEFDVKSDIQSIIINEDIQMLEAVQTKDTKTFVPNIQYGKVLEIISGTEFLVAARIYNGYTKVLAPTLYNFRIRLRNVPFFGIYEECAKTELSLLILNKIVLIKRGVFTADGFIESDIYSVNISYLKQNLQRTVPNSNECLCINDTMCKYITLQGVK